jgi:gentisate 1,2-dioxygenase
MAVNQRDIRVEREQFYEGLKPHNLGPLWTAEGVLPLEPKSKAVPYVWPYEEVREHLMRAGELVTEKEAMRRVLMMLNPGLGGEIATTNNLYAGLQLVLPGEVAPAHHHAAAAIRFIVEGEGAYTTVDGERAIMHPGDLVLTPNWAWHDHGNETDEPMVWLDGLDLPMVNGLETNFFEIGQGDQQEITKPDDASARLYAKSRLTPAWLEWSKSYSPVVNYPWEQTEQVLSDVAGDTDGSPFDGIIFQYTNPQTGGTCMPTMGCFIQQLAPGMHTDAHRHTTSAVYSVVQGHGYSIIDGVRLDWSERDSFCLPGWAVHEHVNGSNSDPAVLFSYTDDPVIRALALYRELRAERQE